ncbi:Hsp20/alpha crystallin family protein [Hungatella hathewayi]|uniref:Hsp20/alpha crystallin family protein n=1 Tax=Hungatella hathewayi TaxID=154046 RepID=UPI00356727DA
MALFPQKKEASEYDINNSSMIIIDMTDDDESYYIYAEFPGREKKEIKVKFKGDKLCLKALEEEDYPDQDYIISERCHDERERIIEFEEPINKKEVTANYINGLLKISIKKIDPEEDEDQDLIQIM